MKIAFSKKVISPEIGTKIAGYSLKDVTNTKYDDLYLTAVCFYNGTKKIAIFGYDLLGIDQFNCKRLRTEAAAILGVEDAAVILSCTHTHSGPNTRTLASCPEILETEYMEQLSAWTCEAARELAEAEYTEVKSYFYSKKCDMNINRRFITSDNRCSFLPHRRDMEKIADEICDKELGGLAFYNAETNQPCCIIGNFAAHPLAGHSPGTGDARISADYPGAFRRYIEQETGADAIFLSGACGDTVPRGHETGIGAIEKVGTTLAMEAIDAIIDATRQTPCYNIASDALEATIEKLKLSVRKNAAVAPEYENMEEIEAEVQVVSIGDVCFIGVPGELVSELGLEMKWHSPFRKTFILYCSTAYMDYLCHGNALVSGGYEGGCQIVDSRSGLKLVNAAMEGAYRIHAQAFPDAEDTLKPLVSLVNIP